MITRCGYAITELTLGGVLADKAAKHGDRVFIDYLPDGRRLTYGDVHQQSSWIAANLLAAGIGQYAHVSVMMENSPEQLLLYFALAKLGAVAVPLNIAARGDQLEYFIHQSDSTALVVDEQFLDRGLRACANLPELKHLIVLRDMGVAELADTAGSARIIDFKDITVPATGAEGINVKHSDIAALMYTSGTTGPSKGNIFTQAHTLQFAADTSESQGYLADDVFYVCLPLFHAMALHGNTLSSLMGGGRIALTRRFSARRFWSDIKESGATLTSALGSMINILVSRPPSEEDRDHRLRLCLTAPLPVFTPEFEKRFNVTLISGYGLSDFGHVASYTAGDPYKPGTCGRPLPGVQLRLVDENDFEVPVGECGEIVLRRETPWSTSSGYYRKPEATIAANRNQWFHTGDRARYDEDGFLYFIDRIKDSIRRRGENISSFEVESVVASHPAVADVAVYAIASEMSEDEVAATIVLKEGENADEASIIAHCAENMGYYMVPRFITFSSDLPRNASLKVEKFRLREAAEANRSELWDREVAGIVLKR